MQFQSDMLNSPVEISKIEEASAFGAALMGGLAKKIWPGIDTIKSLRSEGKKIIPSMDAKTRSSLYKGWKSTINKALYGN